MFFDAKPEDLEQMEKKLLDAMLEVWEREMFSHESRESSILEQLETA